MYVVIFNKLGLLTVFAAVLVGALAGMPARNIVDDEPSVTAIQLGAMIATMLVVDFAWRALHNRVFGWMRFVHPYMGGQLFYVPVWAIAPLLAVVSVVARLCGGH